LHSYLVLATVTGVIRKRETRTNTQYTEGWVGHRGSLKLQRKNPSPFP